jgi:hypothetical protein
MPGAIAVHEPAVEREHLAGAAQADVRGRRKRKLSGQTCIAFRF